MIAQDWHWSVFLFILFKEMAEQKTNPVWQHFTEPTPGKDIVYLFLFYLTCFDNLLNIVYLFLFYLTFFNINKSSFLKKFRLVTFVIIIV